MDGKLTLILDCEEMGQIGERCLVGARCEGSV